MPVDHAPDRSTCPPWPPRHITVDPADAILQHVVVLLIIANGRVLEDRRRRHRLGQPLGEKVCDDKEDDCGEVVPGFSLPHATILVWFVFIFVERTLLGSDIFSSWWRQR